MNSNESQILEQDAQALRARFAALPERQQALLALCLDGGCDLPAAARVLEMPFVQAQAEVRRAVDALREGHGAAPLALARVEALLRARVAAPPELCEALDFVLPGAPCAAITPEGPPVPADAPLQRLLVERPGVFARSHWLRAAAAVLLLGALGLAANRYLRSGDTGVLRVMSGRIRIDGRDTTVVPNDARVENAEDIPAVLRLDDGARVTLQPASVLRLRRASGQGASVELESGAAEFVCASRGKPLSVHTAVADVTAVNSEFTVDLKTGMDSLDQGDENMSKRSMMALAVVVLAGSVSVQYDGTQVALSAGGSRVFAGEGKGDVKPDKGEAKPKGVPPVEIAVDDVPDAIQDAALELVPGIELTGAKLQKHPGEIEYFLTGVSGGVNYEVHFSAHPAKGPKVPGAGDAPGEGKVKKPSDGEPKPPKMKGEPNVESKKPVKGSDVPKEKKPAANPDNKF